jgi:hypothetical protein
MIYPIQFLMEKYLAFFQCFEIKMKREKFHLINLVKNSCEIFFEKLLRQ